MTQRLNLAIKAIDKLPVSDRDQFIRDTKVSGFALKVTPIGARSFTLDYRNARGKTRRITIGKYPTWTPDDARKEAKRLKREIDAGIDPMEEKARVKRAITVRELIDIFLESNALTNETTKHGFRRTAELHIFPKLGKLPIVEMNRGRINELRYDMQSIPSAFNTAKTVINCAWNYCAETNRIDDAPSPCTGVKNFPQKTRKKPVRPEEYKRFGAVLQKYIYQRGTNPFYPLSMAFCAMHGCRPQEARTIAEEEIQEIENWIDNGMPE